MADDGRLYAWYHYERPVCNGSVAAPAIGALRSSDDGATFEDLGIILEATPSLDCSVNSADLTFAGGNGDFSVILDQSQTYFYFFYTNYAVGPASEQGICVARMAYGDRDNPVGKVMKYRNGAWESPGLGGAVTPIFPAATDTRSQSPDFMWGPSLHWNTYLSRYVMLLNRSCCSRAYPQEGIYISFNTGVGNPSGWSQPVKILAGSQTPYGSPGWFPEWYPQVIGEDAASHETDKLAGRVARFYLAGASSWEIVFATDTNPLAVATSTLLAGMTGITYSQTLTASGGRPPYSWSITAGALPPGLALSSNGAIGGTPTSSGTFNFSVQVTDSASLTATKPLAIMIVPGLAITTALLSSGTVGVAYSQALAASGGTPPYSWSITSGAPPPGLTLNSNGAIIGTPTAPGAFNFTVRVTDSNGTTAVQSFAIAIVLTLTLSPVLNSASYTPAVAPGALVSLFGTNLASAVLSAQNLPLPTTMLDTSVSFNGIAAPLVYVSGSQINAQAPFELMPGTVLVQVRRGSASASQTIEVSPAAPAIFARNAQGYGPGAILHASDFRFVTEDNPARAGEYLAIYCTGLGATSPAVPSGNAPPIPPPVTRLMPVVTIAEISVPVIYSGLAPEFVGLYQVNVQVPGGLPAGPAQPVRILMNGVASNAVTIAVR